MKAIVIDEPWIGLILAGEKTWEMRSRSWKHRGSVALIRKASCHVVGVAEMVGSLPALVSLEAYAAAEPLHRISPGEQERAFSKGWRTPWVLENPCRLAGPVPYRHEIGWMSMFGLEGQLNVVNAIEEQLRRP